MEFWVNTLIGFGFIVYTVIMPILIVTLILYLHNQNKKLRQSINSTVRLNQKAYLVCSALVQPDYMSLTNYLASSRLLEGNIILFDDLIKESRMNVYVYKLDTAYTTNMHSLNVYAMSKSTYMHLAAAKDKMDSKLSIRNLIDYIKFNA